GVMVGVVISSVTITTIARHTGSSPNSTGDIIMAGRTQNGTETATGVIGLTTATVIPDGIAGDITAGQ
ncbi:MAG: hypothetical protein PVG96_16900, partial [Desulfobacterales bacterium]